MFIFITPSLFSLEKLHHIMFMYASRVFSVEWITIWQKFSLSKVRHNPHPVEPSSHDPIMILIKFQKLQVEIMQETPLLPQTLWTRFDVGFCLIFHNRKVFRFSVRLGECIMRCKRGAFSAYKCWIFMAIFPEQSRAETAGILANALTLSDAETFTYESASEDNLWIFIHNTCRFHKRHATKKAGKNPHMRFLPKSKK